MSKHKKSSSSGTVSQGGRKKANQIKEAKRQRYFAKKKEEGRGYNYKKNSYDPKTQPEEYATEQYKRQQKAVSHKLPYAKLTSFFAKLDNYLAGEEKKRKEALSN